MMSGSVLLTTVEACTRWPPLASATLSSRWADGMPVLVSLLPSPPLVTKARGLLDHEGDHLTRPEHSPLGRSRDIARRSR